MKTIMKLIIVFCILQIYLPWQTSLFAQLRQDVSVYREDYKVITFNPVTGNHMDTLRTLRFAIKDSYATTDDILILKTSTSSQITASYNSALNKTTITVTILPNDTRDLNIATYFYDLESESLTDTNNVTTLVRGNFNISGDVYNRLSGTDLPADAERYIPVLNSLFDEGEFIKKSGNTFVGDSLLAYLTWSDTTSSIPTKAFLSLYHYTKSQTLALISDSLALALLSANNLSDLSSATIARTNLGVYSTGAVDTFLGAKSDTGHVHDGRYYTEMEVDNLLTPKFNTSDFNSYFESRWDTKTLDSIATGTVNVHLTSTLKGYYDAAYSAMHSHANKSLLDLISATDTTNWHTAYSHSLLTNNPHSVTAAQVGLGNVENTALSTWAGTSNVLLANLGGTLLPAHGGTGTTTQFTQGSVIFVGADGVYSQNNSGLFWNDTDNYLRVPKLIGGSTTTSDLYFQTTTGVGTTGADMHFLVGNNGATEAMTILNNGYVGIGTTSPTAKLDVKGDVHIGTEGPYFSGSALEMDKTFTNTSGTQYGGNFYITGSGSGTATQYGYYMSSVVTGNHSTSYGTVSRSLTSGAVTLTNSYGVFGMSYNNLATGAITNAYGVMGEVYANGGTVGTAYALYGNLRTSASTMGTGYGLYINVPDGVATNPWGIYINSNANSYLGNGNVGIGQTTFDTSATKVLGLGNGTAPTSSIANGVQIYAEDVAAMSELKVRDEAGNITTLSPHNVSFLNSLPTDDDFGMRWGYSSVNPFVGKKINVDLYGFIRDYERRFSKQFIFIEDLPESMIEDWDQNQELISTEREKQIEEWNEKKSKYEKELAEYELLNDEEKSKKNKPSFSEQRPERYTKKDAPAYMKPYLKKKNK